MRRCLLICFAIAAPMFSQAQPKGAPKPYQGQSSSTFSLSVKNGEQTVDISNVTYEVNGSLVLRKSTRTKHVVDEIGSEASTTVEAWPFGTDFRQKPAYTVSVAGVDPVTIEGELLQVSRGLEDTEWWSLYRLANGQHLFDTYTPLLHFSLVRETLTLRYAGLDVPGDDVNDARLKDPHVVSVVTYASAAKAIREALITAEDPKRAQLLRSYADASRTLELVENGNAKSLRLTIRENYPSPPNPVVITIPLAGDDLDVAHAQTPAKIHVAAWKR